MVVLDASGILNAFGFRFDRKFFTTPKVIEEIKDLRSKSLVDVGFESGNLVVLIPSDKSLNRVKKVANELGLLKKLSPTDIEVLALAYEKKDVLWTDDKAMRKVAKKLGIQVEKIIWD